MNITRTPCLRRFADYAGFWSQVDFSTCDIPERFNLGVACADDQNADDPALILVAPDRTFTTYTFGDVTSHANRLANVLLGLGVRRGQVVGVVKTASFETAVAYMALFRMGAIVLPLSSLFGPDALAVRLRHSDAHAVLASDANAAKVIEALGADTTVPVIVIGHCQPEVSGRVGVYAYDEQMAAASNTFTPVDTAAEDPAFLIYTSGTTGDPKGALHAHRVVFGHLPGLAAAYDFFPKPADVMWSPADWAWIAGLMDVLIPAWYYGLPVVVDEVPAFDPERAIWLMREFRVTLAFLPATALRMIRAAGLSGGGFTCRAICSGGEALGADLFAWSEEFFGALVNEGYGQTEFNAAVGNAGSLYPVRPGSLGRALPGAVVAVLDDTGAPVRNQEGEIAVDSRHPNCMLEYWRNAEATAEKFSGNWLLTGDIGVQDDDGYFWFRSRKDDVIKSAGYRIGPGEIENCLSSHPQVAIAAVVGVADERRGQVPKAFVVLRAGEQPSDHLADQLRQHVRLRLAPHEVPREIEFVDDLPRTTTGKVVRRTLRGD